MNSRQRASAANPGDKSPFALVNGAVAYGFIGAADGTAVILGLVPIRANLVVDAEGDE
jgi:hypothetical protein